MGILSALNPFNSFSAKRKADSEAVGSSKAKSPVRLLKDPQETLEGFSPVMAQQELQCQAIIKNLHRMLYLASQHGHQESEQRIQETLQKTRLLLEKIKEGPCSYSRWQKLKTYFFSDVPSQADIKITQKALDEAQELFKKVNDSTELNALLPLSSETGSSVTQNLLSNRQDLHQEALQKQLLNSMLQQNHATLDHWLDTMYQIRPYVSVEKLNQSIELLQHEDLFQGAEGQELLAAMQAIGKAQQPITEQTILLLTQKANNLLQSPKIQQYLGHHKENLSMQTNIWGLLFVASFVAVEAQNEATNSLLKGIQMRHFYLKEHSTYQEYLAQQQQLLFKRIELSPRTEKRHENTIEIIQEDYDFNSPPALNGAVPKTIHTVQAMTLQALQTLQQQNDSNRRTATDRISYLTNIINSSNQMRNQFVKNISDTINAHKETIMRLTANM